MIIAVNTHSLFKINSVAYKATFFEQIKALAASHPDHTFIFIANTDNGIITEKNMQTLIIPAKANGPIRWRIWYDLTLPSAVKKLKADILISTENISIKIKIPQIVLFPALSFLNNDQFYKRSHVDFYRKKLPELLSKAFTIIVPSNVIKRKLTETYKLQEDKVNVLPADVLKPYKPLHWKETALVKEKYSEGKEYFLYVGEISEENNLINLLKAFSRFKKMQKSNMQLILAGNIAENYSSFAESLATYKYKNDVSLLQNLPEEEIIQLTAAAYAFIDVSINMDTNIAALNAIHCEVPVILSKNEAMKECFRTTALFANTANYEDIAVKMMHLFKNEDDRNELIGNGKQLIQGLKPGEISDFLWQCIVSATKQ